ncbi:MAG TPA: hypothetical protein VFZ25_16070 [Chloroflexota bacterium]|nr:hypothetical protein [Chloroflexota bacterium]
MADVWPEPTTSRRDLLRRTGVAAAVLLGGGGAVYAWRTAPTLSVRLGTVGSTSGLWRYTAQRREGLFASRGYAVSFQSFASEAALRAAFLANQLDLIESPVPTVALLRAAGSPVQFFLPTAWTHQSFPFVVRSGSPARSLRDLIGQPVASYPLDDPTMAYWLALAPAVLGIDPRQLALQPSAAPSLRLFDPAVAGACLPTDRWWILAADPGVRAVADLQSAWRVLSGSVRPLVLRGYLAREEFLQRHPAFVSDFVAAHRTALAAYWQDRGAFLNVVAGFHDGPTLSPALSQVQATALGYDDVTTDRLTLSDDDVQGYTRLFPLMAQHGFVQAAPDVGTLFYRPRI